VAADPVVPERPAVHVGVAGVAAWFGVDPRTVSQWLVRYRDTPVPDIELRPGRNGVPDRGWLPSREQEWRDWKASKPGTRRGIPNRNSARGAL
jgi:hypothetical protein